MANLYAQPGFRARFDWGPVGADTVGSGADIVAVVDVLSFTTALSVAVDRGIDVFPYRWRDETAIAYAQRHDAVLAVGRSEAGDGQISLSAQSIRRADDIRRLVLPSPNGSTIAQRVAASGSRVIGVCLRNAEAAAAWISSNVDKNSYVTVIAAGERWPDGSLRPALEDLWGAGALLAKLAGVRPLSPEAAAAAAAYRDAADRLPELLRECTSGRELIAYGYADDVTVAAEVDASQSVPLLTADHFTAAT
ncbi:2-phosphosulfolactate phosphatase [Fodinicola acaciae]|uniref:2-phosphosulfolactate phosphatase n=1 Tax=Fodinicola acaciae TaxID=2681555 RepID=UPI0013D6E9A6|nr:2-phosphosulfolactate phosphatase [Fodinicola acaciae]